MIVCPSSTRIRPTSTAVTRSSLQSARYSSSSRSSAAPAHITIHPQHPEQRSFGTGVLQDLVQESVFGFCAPRSPTSPPPLALSTISAASCSNYFRSLSRGQPIASPTGIPRKMLTHIRKQTLSRACHSAPVQGTCADTGLALFRKRLIPGVITDSSTACIESEEYLQPVINASRLDSMLAAAAEAAEAGSGGTTYYSLPYTRSDCSNLPLSLSVLLCCRELGICTLNASRSDS